MALWLEKWRWFLHFNRKKRESDRLPSPKSALCCLSGTPWFQRIFPSKLFQFSLTAVGERAVYSDSVAGKTPLLFACRLLATVDPSDWLRSNLPFFIWVSAAVIASGGRKFPHFQQNWHKEHSGQKMTISANKVGEGGWIWSRRIGSGLFLPVFFFQIIWISQKIVKLARLIKETCFFVKMHSCIRSLSI